MKDLQIDRDKLISALLPLVREVSANAAQGKLELKTSDAPIEHLEKFIRDYAEQYARERVEEARKDQDEHSRTDEFLWFARKLREYMWKSKSNAYKAFLSNFVEPNEDKYRQALKSDPNQEAKWEQ